MNRETKDILLSEVKSVSHVKHDEEKFNAIFHLGKGVDFNGELTYNKYTFTPVQQVQVPEIKQIIWRKEHIFNSSDFITKVTFTDLCSQANCEEYKKLLAPTRMYVGGHRLFPYEFQYVPLLEHATQICKAWRELQKFTQKVKLARHNLKDALALRKASFDLREYF